MSVYTQITAVMARVSKNENRSLRQWSEWFKQNNYSMNYLPHFITLLLKYNVDLSTIYNEFRKTVLIKAFSRLKMEGYNIDKLTLTTLESQCYNDLTAKQMLRYKEHLLVLWPDRFKPIIECLEVKQ